MAERATELAHVTAVVTGAGGFLGSALTERLATSGARVIALDSGPSARSIGDEPTRIDLRDVAALRSALPRLLGDSASSATVFHLAGRGHIGNCRDDPGGAVAVNVVGTTNLLEVCREVGVQRVVFPSTALVYRIPARSPLREDAPVDPRSIYAATKLACEAILSAYWVEFGLSSMVARLGNVYGHGAAKDTVAAIILRQVLDGGPIVVNSLSPVRDFIYRDDVVSGLIALATLTSVDGHQVFNLSSGVPTSIRDVAETAAAVAGVRQEPIERFPDTSAGQDRVVLAIDRLRKATSWTPSFSLETGLRASLVEAGFVQ